MLAGILHLVTFGAAGVLSSHFATVDNEVLLAPSQSCGVVSVLPRFQLVLRFFLPVNCTP